MTNTPSNSIDGQGGEGKAEERPKLNRNDFPHLVKLEQEVKALASKLDSKEYWKARCQYLEKSYDPTYSDFERSNCNYYWSILVMAPHQF